MLLFKHISDMSNKQAVVISVKRDDSDDGNLHAHTCSTQIK